jgi:uncharacterized protein (TIGR02001 family)
MKKLIVTAAMVAGLAASASAADLKMITKAPPPPAPPPPAFDIAFGGAIMTDYNFRGVSQSNRGASAGAYVEPQLTLPLGTIYVGLAGWSIEWPSAPNYGFSDPAAEIDFYGGWRNSWGPFSLDLGLIYYYYPSEQFGIDSDFWEFYAKAGYDITSNLNVGANIFYTPDLLNYGQFGFGDVEGVYGSLTGSLTLPVHLGALGVSISGELGHWWIDNVISANTGLFVDPS